MLLGLWAFIFLLTAVPELHHVFHVESDSPTHHCAVEQLTHGIVAHPTPDPVLNPVWQFFTAPLPTAGPDYTGDVTLAHSRAPPSATIQIVAVG